MTGHRKTVASAGQQPRYMGGGKGFLPAGRLRQQAKHAMRQEQWDSKDEPPPAAQPGGPVVVRLRSLQRVRKWVDINRAFCWTAQGDKP